MIILLSSVDFNCHTVSSDFKMTLYSKQNHRKVPSNRFQCNGHALLSTPLRFSFPIVIHIRKPYAAKYYCLQISYADMLTKVDPLRNELKSLEIEAQASRIKVSKQWSTM